MQVLDYLKKAVADEASDIFFLAGSPVTEKVDGRIKIFGTEKLLPEDTKILIKQVYEMASHSMEKYERTGDDDFSC